jgi:hypothetical protein
MSSRIGCLLCIIIAAALLLTITASSAKTSCEPTDVEVGVRPLYGLVLGEYSGNYFNAPGGIVYGRGLYELNIEGKLMLYPEFSWGVLYLGNKSEKSRELFLFPFALNIYFDAPMLNFKTKAGVFALRPYIGLGAYLNYYKSSGAEATGCDFGYQAGVNLEYRHENMKNCYVELSVDHLFTTNFKQYLPMLAFSAGAGYAVEFRGPTTAAEKADGDKVESLPEKHIEDRNSNDENKGN